MRDLFLCVVILIIVSSIVTAAPGDKVKYVTEPRFSTFSTVTNSKISGSANSVEFRSYTSAHIRASNPHNISASQIGLANYNGAAGFNNISTNAIYIRQGANAQALELYEAAENGNSIVTIAVQSQMSSSRVLTIGNHGLYIDGVQVVTW